MDTKTKTKIIDSLVYIKSNIGLEEYADKLIKAVQEEHEYYQDNFRTKKYKVEWCRTYYCYGSIEVEALSEDEAKEKAIRLAFKKVLFYGIPSSSVPEPMLEQNEDYYKNNHEIFYNDFFYGNEMKRFLSCEDLISKNMQKTKTIKVKMLLCIEINNLRSYLEKKGVKRKLGF